MINLRSPRARQSVLVVATGLVVVLVRHGLESHWQPFDSVEQLLVGWLIHSIGVLLLSGIAAAAIASSSRFFTGGKQAPDLEDLVTYALITILIGTIAILVVASWPERDEEDSLRLQHLSYSVIV